MNAEDGDAGGPLVGAATNPLLLDIPYGRSSHGSPALGVHRELSAVLSVSWSSSTGVVFPTPHLGRSR